MKMFKSLLIGLFILGLSSHVMGADSIKLGVIDIQRFQKDSKAFQQTTAELRKQYDQMQTKLEEEKNAMIKAEEELRKKSMMLSLDAQEDKRRELEKKRRYYKYLVEDYSQEMKNLEVVATKKVGKEIEQIVEEMGQKEGFILILEKRMIGLIYYHNSIDITDRVIQAYDKMKLQ
jgi:outer membrane protein